MTGRVPILVGVIDGRTEPPDRPDPAIDGLTMLFHRLRRSYPHSPLVLLHDPAWPGVTRNEEPSVTLGGDLRPLAAGRFVSSADAILDTAHVLVVLGDTEAEPVSTFVTRRRRGERGLRISPPSLPFLRTPEPVEWIRDAGPPPHRLPPWHRGKRLIRLRDSKLRALDRFNALMTRESDHSPALPNAAGLFAITDGVALRLQSRLRVLLIALLGLAAVSVLFNALRPLLPEAAQWAGPVCAAASLLLFAVLKSGGIEQDVVGYRTLAESLRVQMAWDQAGIPFAVAEILPIRHGPGDWIELVVRSMTAIAPPAACPSDRRSALRSVLKGWVGEQRRYFVGADGQSGAAARDYRRAMVCRWSAAAFLLLALGAAGLGSLVGAVWPSSFAPVFASGFVAFLAYENVMAFGENHLRFRAAGDLFAAAESALEAALASGALDRGQDILVELGRMAVGETSDWALIRGQRPVSLPTLR